MLRAGSFMREGAGLKSRGKNEALSSQPRSSGAPDIPEQAVRAQEEGGGGGGGEPYKIAILPREKLVVQDNRSTSRLARKKDKVAAARTVRSFAEAWLQER